MTLSDAQLDRYARHIVLREIGGEGQRRFQQAEVIVIGAGGIGSPAIQYLATAGIGALRVIDDDAVALDNLQRQILFGTGDVGRAKTEVAEEAVTRLNPDVRFDGRHERLTGANVAALIEGGTLVLDGLRPGKNLYLLGTGTGLAPFLSLARDPEVYERFEKVIVTHTVRQVADLNYRELLEHDLPNDETLGEMVEGKLRYYPTVTREPFKTQGRITDLIASGKLFDDLGVPPLDPAVDRLMLCGGPSVLADLKQLLLDRGYEEGSIASPGDFVLEKAFVET